MIELDNATIRIWDKGFNHVGTMPGADVTITDVTGPQRFMFGLDPLPPLDDMLGALDGLSSMTLTVDLAAA
jgi:hypothetical protein